MKFDSSGKYVATSSMDNSLKVFSLEEPKEDAKQGKGSLECEASGNIADAWKIDFSSDASSILTGSF